MDGTCPDPIKRTVLFNEWRRLVFLHWRYDPAEVQALLPDGLTVDTFDGSAWVALVPFEMRVGLFGVPALPYLTVFPETNVRTYVIGPDGRTGVYFFSLDVNRPHVVGIARSIWGVPYTLSKMTMSGTLAPQGQSGAQRWTFDATRIWPARGARSHVDVEVGDEIPADEVGPLEHFLTSRWALYQGRFGRITRARVDHPAWPLRHATLHNWHDELIVAAGFSAPTGAPHVLASHRVDVRLGAPHLV